jgi:ammonia channel protein AmtB
VQEVLPAIDSGDTAWMITATALVLLMTIPGLALFYAGMVRVKSALSVLMQCFAITALVSVLWMVYGYSLAFSTTGMTADEIGLHSFIGGLDKAFLAGISAQSVVATIPESVFAMFQMTFAIITPALIVGAFAERMKFGALLAFTALWFTFIYAPMAHMVWSGDGALMWDWGVLDFAGGTVVHVNAGIAGLVAAQLESVRVRAMDADVAVMPPRRFDELLEVALARPRFNALLITLFGSGALFLAAIGLCAAMTAVVRERRREIAVRVALGATAGDVRRLVLGEGARLVAVGAVAGMAVAGVTTRVLQSLLFDVQPFDAVSWIGALFLITAVTMLALYLPVRQAARVDSASTLRAE